MKCNLKTMATLAKAEVPSTPLTLDVLQEA